MLSIVVPIFNEKGSLPALYKNLSFVMKSIKEQYELIFIDDGSTDGSFELLKELEKRDKKIRIFSFRKNQGKSEALTLGFSKAGGDYVITLDADLQDKPSEIPKLLKKVKEGWSVVCGWRVNRHDPSLKVFSSRFFNFLARLFWNINLHDYNCGFKIYTREAAKSLHLYGGLHRFIPLLIHQQGFTITEVPINHEKRKFGKSKYGFSKLWRDLPDIFTMIFLSRYSSRPLHFFGMVGGLLFIAGTVILIYLSIIHFQGQAIGRRPLLFLGMLLVLSGFQVFFTGLLADLIISISYNKKKEFSIKYSSGNN